MTRLVLIEGARRKALISPVGPHTLARALARSVALQRKWDWFAVVVRNIAETTRLMM